MSWRLVSSSINMDRMLFRTLKSGEIRMITNRGLRNVSLQNSPALSDVLERFMTWCKPPKGFEKFFRDKPKAGEKSQAQNQEAKPANRDKQIPRPNLNKPSQSQSDTSKDFQEMFKKFKESSGGGAGGGSGGMNDGDKQKWMQLIGMGVVTAAGLAIMNASRYREIS